MLVLYGEVSMLNKNDYVRIKPQTKTLNKHEIRFNIGSISLFTNIDNFENVVDYGTINSGECRTIGSITALFLPYLIIGSNTDKDMDDEYLPKNNDLYVQGVENALYESDNYRVLTNYYSNHGIVYTNGTDIFIVCSTLFALYDYIRMAIKQLLANAYKLVGKIAIHASAVEYKGRGYLFVAGSRSGKTTIFMNLINNGFLPLNDDLLFLSFEKDGVYILSEPMRPSIRIKSLKYISYIMPYNEYMLNGSSCIYPDINSLCNVNHVHKVALDKILYPSLSEVTSIRPNIDAKRSISRLCKSLFMDKKTDSIDNLSTIIERLINIDSYNLYCGGDMKYFCDCFINYFDA